MVVSSAPKQEEDTLTGEGGLCVASNSNSTSKVWQLSNTITVTLIGIVGGLLGVLILWVHMSIMDGDRETRIHFAQLMEIHKEKDLAIQTTVLNSIIDIQKNDQRMIELIRSLQQDLAVIKRNQEIRLERERGKGR